MAVATQLFGVLAAICGIVASILGLYLHRRYGAIIAGWIACLCLVSGFFCWLFDAEWKREARKPPEPSGESKSTGDNSPIDIARPSSEKFHRFTVGGAGGLNFTADKLRERKWSALREDCSLKLYMVRDKLKLDFAIYTDQDIAPMIEGNEIKFLPAGFQINKNEKAYEIVDRSLNPIFQFINTEGSDYTIFGLFRCASTDNRQRVVVAERESVRVFDLPIPLGTAQPVLKEKRIFKYPAWQFNGVLNDGR